MKFRIVPLSGTSYVIAADGPIADGDTDKLVTVLGALPETWRVAGLALNSPGGQVTEAAKLSAGIKHAGMAVFVADGSICASACFLLFASAPHKMVGHSARIGVHSVSEDGAETMASMAFTTMFARAAAELNVPSQIIGRLVSTGPDQVAWLNEVELLAMGAEFFPGSPAAPAPVPLAPAATSPVPSFGAIAAQAALSRPGAPAPVQTAMAAPFGGAPVSPAFQDGQADRERWEAWFAGTSGDYHTGAEFWAGQRNTPHPGTCFGPAGQAIGDFTAGCQQAKAMLAPIDARRRGEADYKAGWNMF